MNLKDLTDRVYNFLDQELDSEVLDLSLADQDAYLAWSREEIAMYLNQSIWNAQLYNRNKYINSVEYVSADLVGNTLPMPEDSLGIAQILGDDETLIVATKFMSYSQKSTDYLWTEWNGDYIKFSDGASFSTYNIYYTRRYPQMVAESDTFPMPLEASLFIILSAVGLASLKFGSLSTSLERRIAIEENKFVAMQQINGTSGVPTKIDTEY